MRWLLLPHQVLLIGQNLLDNIIKRLSLDPRVKTILDYTWELSRSRRLAQVLWLIYDSFVIIVLCALYKAKRRGLKTLLSTGQYRCRLGPEIVFIVYGELPTSGPFVVRGSDGSCWSPIQTGLLLLTMIPHVEISIGLKGEFFLPHTISYNLIQH